MEASSSRPCFSQAELAKSIHADWYEMPVESKEPFETQAEGSKATSFFYLLSHNSPRMSSMQVMSPPASMYFTLKILLP